ncbi:MAG: DUF1015 domain-containing protein [Clostridia bacterium]|nr:DUF1015 domain-containing protein [Clostridia bacterium]
MKPFTLQPADILLPKKGIEQWSVVACDQFTSQPEYWQQVEEFVGDAPSTLRITLPEAYLEDRKEERIAAVNQTMEDYVANGVFEEHKNAMILVHRTTVSGTRKGLLGIIDLNEYDYRKGSNALIRATEETVLERIPPRVQIRKDASLELPHVLLMMDDPDGNVIGCVEQKIDSLATAYDFELMQKGGHLTGYFIPKALQQKVQAALNNLLAGQDDPMMFVVGDGNHSLATAKECAALNDSPAARYALVEVVNIHDPSIQFEPIYRVLFNVNKDHLLAYLQEKVGAADGDGHPYTVVDAAGESILWLSKTAELPVGTLQPVLDAYLKENPEVKIDYIHGDDTVHALCKQENTLGFIFEGMTKEQLFPAVSADGSLPRKTFSMGHAEEKRYYTEARKIK